MTAPTPAQRQATHLTELAGHLHRNPGLTPVSAGPHGDVQVWATSDPAEAARQMVAWFRSLDVEHLVVRLYDDYAAVHAYHTPLGGQVWGGVPGLHRHLVEAGYPDTPEAGLALTVDALEHFAGHGTLPEGGEPQ